MKIEPIFAWYDIWIGVFWDRKQRILYILLIPMLGLKISFPRPAPVDKTVDN